MVGASQPTPSQSRTAGARREVGLIKSKFFIACLSLALAVALFTGVFAIMGWSSLLGTVGSTIVYPFQWAATRAGDAVRGFASYFADVDELRDENEFLRAELESVKGALLDAEITRDESAWLYHYLSLKEEHEDYGLCAATVIAFSTAQSESGGGEYLTEITVNRGTLHGVREGMPVVTPLGLVGVVVEAEINHARIRTLLDTSVSVASVTTRGAQNGLCEGDYSLIHDGQARLRYLPEEADVAEGDIVVTSGRGSVYPYGIPVGRVVAVNSNAYSRTTEATIQPFVDMTELESVMILTSFYHYVDGFGAGEDAS